MPPVCKELKHVTYGCRASLGHRDNKIQYARHCQVRGGASVQVLDHSKSRPAAGLFPGMLLPLHGSRLWAQHNGLAGQRGLPPNGVRLACQPPSSQRLVLPERPRGRLGAAAPLQAVSAVPQRAHAGSPGQQRRCASPATGCTVLCQHCVWQTDGMRRGRLAQYAISISTVHAQGGWPC